ncbi:MAG TPA: PEP-CTERM sorting domain-containing protein [Gemmataceae bacterium]|nr:PEP-CTERM sorting domain-containing protein [Gemmataceae bacterium]
MRSAAILLAAFAFLGQAHQVFAGPVYLRSTVGQPWGQSTNETAMDAVFGAGNWADSRYETVDTATLFSPATNFIFMEGGDNNANALNAFLIANMPQIEAWVLAGGSLFVNAAPNEGGNIAFPFGVTLNYPGFSATATAVDPGNPIFNGPFTPVATSYTGNWFAHAFVSGSGITSLIDGTAGSVLAEGHFGQGYVLFGGMTTDNFHQPQPDAANLTANIIAFGAAQSNASVPEPASVALFGAMAIGGAVFGWRRREKAQAA